MGKAMSKEKGGGPPAGLEGGGADAQKTVVEIEVPFDQYSFPFENAVFGGGPLTSLAYIGAVRFLEDVGIWSRVQRLAGSGSGAVIAALLCIGFNSHQLQNILETDLRTLAEDHVCGKLCLGCKMSSTFGWSPNKKCLKWFGTKMKEAFGKQDATFLEVYQKFGKELCVVVTNVSQGRLEFCHPKTTPRLPVVEAVQMSLATPGICSPVKNKVNGEDEYFVDGAFLDAYPIYCFDGWWLSMSSADSFLKTLTSMNDLPALINRSNRFGTVNAKTLGFLVYDESSLESLARQLDERNRLGDKVVQTNTSASKKWTETRNRCNAVREKYSKYKSTADKFMKALATAIPDQNKIMEKPDLHDAVQKDTTLGTDNLTLLFGSKHSTDDIWDLVKSINKGAISQQDFSAYFGQKCVAIEAQYRAINRKEIKNFVDYFEALQISSVENSRLAIATQDLDRTIGINIHFLTGLRRGKLDKADQKFLVEQGKLCAKAYLQQFISKSVPPIKDAPNRRSFCRDDLPCFIDDDVSEIIDERDYMENLIGRVL